MKTKILLWSVVSILILGLAAGVFWWQERPQVITFSDDAKLTLLSVEYGKRHAAPGVKLPAATAGNRAPAARRGNNSFTTTNDTLVAWVREQYDSQQYHYFQFYAYDKAGTACVQTYGRNYGNGRRGSNEVVAVQLDAFPRRQGKFYLRVQEQGNGAQEMSEQKFVISNPARGKSFTQWTPEPVPSTKQDDDVSVTLTKLVAGADMPYQRNQDNADDPANKGVQAVFHVERNGKTASNWQPVSVTTDDGTGNHVNGNVSQNNWQNDEDTVVYQYGLWPDEPAWKIKLEFSQQSDFADSELWTVQSLPVLPGKQQEMYNYGGNRRQAMTNAPFAENDLNGFHLKLYPAKEFTDAGNNNWMQGGLFLDVSPAVADGWRMTIKVTDTETNDIQSSEYNNYRNNNVSNFRYRLQDISGLTNLNVSIALHKSRFIEFTAKPEKGAAAAAQ
jgi:hypothetical protein